MQTKHKFDMTMDAQKVFRIVLEALSNPGRVKKIEEYTYKFADNGEWLALAVTLLDGEVSYYSNLHSDIKNEIHFLTGCHEEAIEKADFILIENMKPEEVLAKAKEGTHIDPHDSAFIIIKSMEEPVEKVYLNGPGVPPEGRTLFVSKEEKEWLETKESMNYEYPCGVELLFLRASGEIVAVTRKVGA